MYKLILLVGIITTSIVQVQDLTTDADLSITIDHIRKELNDARDGIKSAHIVRIEQTFRDEMSEKNLTKDLALLRKIDLNQEWVSEANILIDCGTGNAKSIRTDIRDLNEIGRTNGLSPEESASLSQDRITLIKGNYHLILFHDSSTPRLVLDKESASANSFLTIPYLGTVDQNTFDDKYSPKIVGYSPFIVIETTIPLTNGMRTGRFELDPELQYHIRSIRWYQGSICTGEFVADDYRNINGILYPFIFKMWIFNPTTGIRRRENSFYVQEAQFNIPLSEKDFKTFIPKDTLLSCVQSEGRVLKGGCYLGIDDILEMNGEPTK